VGNVSDAASGNRHEIRFIKETARPANCKTLISQWLVARDRALISREEARGGVGNVTCDIVTLPDTFARVRGWSLNFIQQLLR